MKNTYITLDIILLDSKCEVVCLIKNAKPLDEKLVGCKHAMPNFTPYYTYLPFGVL